MSNVAKLQKALESIDGMTDAEYEILYKSAKQADDNLVSIENYDEIIARNQEVKKMLMHMKMRADNMRARTHKTRHGRHEVFSCYKSNSAYTTRGLSNAISAGRRLTIYGSSGASLSRFGRSISVMSA